MAAEKYDSMKDLQARIDALSRKKEQGDDAGERSAAEVARAVRASSGRTRQTAPQQTGTRQTDSGPAAPEPQSRAGKGDAVVYRRELPRRQSAAPRPARRSQNPVSLEDALSGCEEVHPDLSAAYHIRSEVAGMEGAGGLNGGFREALCREGSALAERLAAATNLTDLTPHDFVFFDIETTGLSSSPLFLIGAMDWEEEGLVVRQYLARDYSEEAAVIALFAEVCRGKRLFVSFNGKSFDLPYIKVRAATHHVPLQEQPAVHFDLLHECRRIWRGALPDCRLQTLETWVCKRSRQGDIPSAEIPDAYHEFVRTRDAGDLVEILKHNVLDLVTLADLMTRLPPLKRDDEPGGR